MIYNSKRYYSKPTARKTYQQLKLHAVMRFSERFNVKLNQQKYQEACKAIKIRDNAGQVEYLEFLHYKSNNRSLHLISITGIVTIAVWDKKRQAVVTFLYKEGRKNCPLKNLLNN